jgi:hypothetical protein
MSVKYTTLKVDQVEKYQNLYFQNLYHAGVQGHGTCFIHSYLYLTDPVYRNLSSSKKKTYGENYRKNFSKDVLSMYKSKKKEDDEITKYLNEEVMPTLDTNKYPTIEDYIEKFFKNPCKWLDGTFIPFFEKLLMINIVILKDKTFYQRSTDVYDRNLKTIIILNIANIHYEPVFFSENEEYIYELKEENRVLRSKLIRTYNKFAYSNTNEPSFVESEHTTIKDEKESNPDEKESNPDEKESNPDETESNPDEKESNPDETESNPDETESNPDETESNPDEKESNPDDIEDIPKVDLKTIELVHEEIPSTELDYFEMIISEDDIIFEPINDLGEITLTRFNNDAPTVYTRNQTYNEINELYKFDTKKMNDMNYLIFVNMLFTNKFTKKNLLWTKSVVPVINAKKEYITELYVEEEEEDSTNDHTNINMWEFFNERNSKRTVTYNVAKKDIEEANKFLTTVTGDEFLPIYDLKNQSNESVLRICPTFTDTLKSYEYEVLENGSRCMDITSQVLSNMSPTEMNKHLEKKKLQQDFVDKNNFLEFYSTSSVNKLNINGIFVSELDKTKKFSKRNVKVFNFSKYLLMIQNLKKDEKVTLYFTKYTETRTMEGVVENHNNNIIKIRLNQEILYKNDLKKFVYYLLQPDTTQTNWFTINTEENSFDYKKQDLLVDRTLFIFEEGQYNMFKKLILPDVVEFLSLKFKEKEDTLQNLDDVIELLSTYYDFYSYDINQEVQNLIIKYLEKVVSTHKSINLITYSPIDETNLEPVYKASKSESLEFMKILKQKKLNEIYSTQLTNKKLSNLHKSFLLHHSFDNGYMLLMSFIHDQLTKIDTSTSDTILKRITYFKDELNKLEGLKRTDLQEKFFYENINELTEYKKQLVINNDYKETHSCYVWLNSLYESHKRASIENSNSFNILSKQKGLFYKINIKPQNFKNISFLKKINEHNINESTYFGNEDVIDFDEMFNVVEDTRDLNYEVVGDSTSIKDTMENDKKKFTRKNPLMYIKEIAHYFGIIKLNKSETEYILTNLKEFLDILVSEKKKAIFLKNPKMKKDTPFQNMFKKSSDMEVYLEYSNIVNISAFILILVSINRTDVEVTRLYSRCKSLFALQGYPLSKDTKSERSTLNYFACLLTGLFSKNENFKDVDRTKKKLINITEKILERKPELHVTLKTVNDKLKKSADLHDQELKGYTMKDMFVNFKPSHRFMNKPTNICKNYVSYDSHEDDIIYNQTQMSYSNKNTSSCLLQLKRKRDVRNDINLEFKENVTFKERILYTYDKIAKNEKGTIEIDNLNRFTLENPDYADDIKDLLTIETKRNIWRNFTLNTENKLNNIQDLIQSFHKEQNNDITDMFETLTDTYIVFKHIDEHDAPLYDEHLFKFMENKLFTLFSKSIHKFSRVQHIQFIGDSSLMFLQKSKPDKEFTSKVANDKYDVNSQANRIVEDLQQHVMVIERLKKIKPPKAIDTLIFINTNNENKAKNNVSNSALVMLNVIMTFFEKILTSILDETSLKNLQTDIYTHLSQDEQNLREITTLITHLILDTVNDLSNSIIEFGKSLVHNYDADVQEMRELDKKQKFDFKNNMGDEQRLLYINLESINALPNDYQNMFSQNDILEEDTYIPTYDPAGKPSEFDSFLDDVNDDQYDM